MFLLRATVSCLITTSCQSSEATIILMVMQLPIKVAGAKWLPLFPDPVSTFSLDRACGVKLGCSDSHRVSVLGRGEEIITKIQINNLPLN